MWRRVGKFLDRVADYQLPLGWRYFWTKPANYCWSQHEKRK